MIYSPTVDIKRFDATVDVQHLSVEADLEVHHVALPKTELDITLDFQGGEKPVVGDQNELIVVAAQDISALRAVSIRNNQAYACDARDPANRGNCSGVSVTAATLGQTIKIRRFGEVDITGLTLAAVVIWAGDNGELTQPPLDLNNWAFIQQVGRVIDTNTMTVDIDDYIPIG